MATKPRRAVEAVHQALQHHILVERDLADLHKALLAEPDNANVVEVLRAKSEHLALSARLFALAFRLDVSRDRSRAWRFAQLRRKLKEDR